MKEPKDLFSEQSKLYKLYRPQYPEELFKFIFNEVSIFDKAWDCATGNGQVVVELAKRFAHVYASDLSREQISNAVVKENISYKVERSESTSFPDNYFDLITVGQAFHWFDFNAFFKEAKRVSKKEGVLAVWGYGLFDTDGEIKNEINNFYNNVVGPYWDKERVHVENKYVDIAFPFSDIKVGEFSQKYLWDKETFEGYFNTWSSVRKFEKANGYSPVAEMMKNISNEVFPLAITFPIFIKTGKI